MSEQPFGTEWNEFQWEREIRRDELRICRYFQILLSCLDLPGEDEIIMTKLMSQKDLVPTGMNGKLPPGSVDFFSNMDEEEQNAEDGWLELRLRKGSEMFLQLERCARNWNIYFAANDDEQLQKAALAVSCQFGKLLARLSNFLSVEDAEFSPLKISLGKRVLADLNDLIGNLRRMIELDMVHADKFFALIEEMQYVRERTVDMISSLRLNCSNK